MTGLISVYLTKVKHVLEDIIGFYKFKLVNNIEHPDVMNEILKYK